MFWKLIFGRIEDLVEELVSAGNRDEVQRVLLKLLAIGLRAIAGQIEERWAQAGHAPIDMTGRG